MVAPYLTDEQAAALRRLGFAPSVASAGWIRWRVNDYLYVIRQRGDGWFVRRTTPGDDVLLPRLGAACSPTLPMDALLVWCEVEGFL